MNDRAISELVSTVLLISITVALGGAVFAWLKFYVQNPIPTESCPDINIIIYNYSCDLSLKTITLTVQNRGLFNISGFYAKMNDVGENDPGGGTAGKYPLMPNKYPKTTGPAIAPSQKITITPPFSFQYFNDIKQIELEPYIIGTGATNVTLCEKAVMKQRIECVAP